LVLIQNLDIQVTKLEANKPKVPAIVPSKNLPISEPKISSSEELEIRDT